MTKKIKAYFIYIKIEFQYELQSSDKLLSEMAKMREWLEIVNKDYNKNEF